MLLGYREFRLENEEGPEVKTNTMGPEVIIAEKYMQDRPPPWPIVAFGLQDENWGWMSSYILNRTAPWATSFVDPRDPKDPNYRPLDDQVCMCCFGNV